MCSCTLRYSNKLSLRKKECPVFYFVPRLVATTTRPRWNGQQLIARADWTSKRVVSSLFTIVHIGTRSTYPSQYCVHGESLKAKTSTADVRYTVRWKTIFIVLLRVPVTINIIIIVRTVIHRAVNCSPRDAENGLHKRERRRRCRRYYCSTSNDCTSLHVYIGTRSLKYECLQPINRLLSETLIVYYA